jgi:hypothetical protein
VDDKHIYIGMVITLALCAAAECIAGPVLSAKSTPAAPLFYTTFGSGDVVFNLESDGLTQCTGFWLRPSDSGFKTTFAGLLTAVHAGTPIFVYADDAQLWPGSGDPWCLVTGIRY